MFLNVLQIVLFLLFSIPLAAQNFENTSNCKLAYQNIYKLKINEGLQWVVKEKKENPTNYLIYFIENHADFLKLNINDNIQLFNEIKPKVELRLEKLKAGNINSPYYLYTQADIHLQWALCRIKFGEYIGAVFEVKKAYSMLLDNQRKFPEFKPNIKSLGLLHTLFGAVPDKYKLGVKLLGLKGSIPLGLSELNLVIKDTTFQFREESIIMYTLLLLHLQQDKTASWDIIENAEIPLGDNLLNYFVAATVAEHTARNEDLIKLLTERPTGSMYYPFPYLDFMYGYAKLNRLDDDADIYIKKFIATNKGRSYQKEAYRKLAWYYLINGEPSLYKKYMEQVLLVKDAPTDEDRSAQKEAEQAILPQRDLLKARVLFDGSYFEKALSVINTISPANLNNNKDRIEYLYRKGRIYDALHRYNDAIKFYMTTIEKGQNYQYYFTANASIKLANIFEQQHKKANAIQYYKKALSLDKDEYTNSINAEAKAGLNRLGE